MEYMEHPWERYYSDKQLITHNLIPVLYHCERFSELGILQRTRPLGDWGITKTKWAETQFDKRHSKDIMDLATV